MARRGVSEVSAGAMADIAFLLLVFFIVTSTMDPENAVRQEMPKRVEIDVPPPPTRERDILRIQTNRNNEIYVREVRMARENLDVLAEQVKEFFNCNMDHYQTGSELNPQCPSCPCQNYPFYQKVDRAWLNSKISHNEGLRDASSDDDMISFYDGMIANFEKKKQMLAFLGVSSYNEINSSAKIILDMDPNTDYGLYLEIRGVVKGVIEELRSERAEEYFDMPYPDMVKHIDNADDAKEIDPEIKEMYDVLKTLVPERISEPDITK